MRSVAETLKQLRIERHLSRRELAKEIGYKDSVICSYECGRTEPKLENLVQLAEYYDVSLSYIIGMTDMRNRKVEKKKSEKDKIEIKIHVRLKELRKEKKLSQTCLGRKIGCGHSSIANYESGRNRPTIKKILGLLKVFDVSIEYLIGFTCIKNEHC